MLSEKEWINQRELTLLKEERFFKKKKENYKSCLWEISMKYFWVRKASCSKLCIIWRYTCKKEILVKKEETLVCRNTYTEYLHTYICMSIENYRRLYTELLIEMREFSGCPVVKTSPSNPGDVGSIPGQETKVPHASRPKKENIKHCNKYNEDLQKWSSSKYLKKKKRRDE